MTAPEYFTVANLARLRSMQAILDTFEVSQLEENAVRLDIGLPLQKWIERLAERLPKGG